ncbi:MAG: T9SS type A sorting domain-containing protein, partial [Bacteroidota bacterium]|nr:T9SS type A sorting domain-containing protein [Bacteroidota bacterium]
MQSAGGYQGMIHNYVNIIETCDAYADADVHYYKDIAWGSLHDVLDAYFAFINHATENTGFNQSLDDVMLLNETLMENPDVSRIGYYEYSLDNALLERLRENYNQSLTMLESLKFDIPEMDREIAYIDRWHCYIDAEREAKLGNLVPDAFMAAIQDCRQTYENTIEDIHAQDSLNAPGTEQSDNTDTPAPNLTIIPNPNAGNFTVEVYCEAAGSEIKINNIYGQPVRTINLTDDGQQSVQVSGLAQGQYTVYYLENG